MSLPKYPKISGGNAEALFMSKPGALLTVGASTMVFLKYFFSADLQRGIVIQAHPCAGKSEPIIVLLDLILYSINNDIMG